MIERRFCELREAGGRRLTGTAVRYGDVATGLPWPERFEAGAFQPIGDVMLNSQHDRATPLARTGAGLELHDSLEALEVRAELPPVSSANDVLELVRAGVLRGLSTEFTALSERMDGEVRVIERARLSGVAVVDSPAYPASEVEARRAGVEWRKPIGARGDRARLRSRVPFNRRVQCTCHRALCDDDITEVVFEPDAFDDPPATLIAVAKDYASPLAALGRGTLRTRRTRDSLDIEMDLPDTAAGQDLIAASANVPLIVRPLFDQDASDFTEAAGVATYSRVALRAWLVGATDRSRGWPEAEIDDPRPTRRRSRIWL